MISGIKCEYDSITEIQQMGPEAINNQAGKTTANSKILAMCRTTVNKKLGSLDDLPYELANTVVNIFYRYFETCVRWAGTKVEASLGDGLSQGNSGDLDEALFFERPETFASLYSRTKQEHEAIEKMRFHLRQSEDIVRMVKGLRDIDRERNPLAYEAKAMYILDMMKYKIKDANKKSDIIREIERDLKRKEVDEIPDLYQRFRY